MRQMDLFNVQVLHGTCKVCKECVYSSDERIKILFFGKEELSQNFHLDCYSHIAGEENLPSLARKSLDSVNEIYSASFVSYK